MKVGHEMHTTGSGVSFSSPRNLLNL